MQNCLCSLRAECPGKKSLGAPGKLGVPALRVGRRSHWGSRKGKNADILLECANELWKLGRMVQGGSHPGSGGCRARCWARIIGSCPCQVTDDEASRVGFPHRTTQRAWFHKMINYSLICSFFTTSLAAHCTVEQCFWCPKRTQKPVHVVCPTAEQHRLKSGAAGNHR